jgi:hypothetical protein
LIQVADDNDYDWTYLGELNCTILHLATKHQLPNILQLLLDSPQCMKSVNVSGHPSISDVLTTPLEEAASYGNAHPFAKRCVKLLWLRGAQYNLCDRDTNNVLTPIIKCHNRMVFLMGTKERLGKDSSVRTWTNMDMFDVNLLKVVFSF